MPKILEDAVFTGLALKKLDAAPKMFYMEREQFFDDIEEEVKEITEELNEE